MSIAPFLDEETTLLRNEKLDHVREFITNNCYLAPQGSEEWLKTRQSIIGGSELSTITGDNPWSSVADLVASKCGLSKFVSNVATKWGNIFEELTRIITQILFLPDIPLSDDCIYETGSLVGVIPYHRFSPDGLTVMVFRQPNGKLQPMIVLLEFKSPLSSVPKNDVPKHYLPQVKAGMCDIERVEIGLFVNNMFRKCSLKQFGNNSKYNVGFHKSDIKKNVAIGDPLAIGILGLYQTKEQRAKFIEMVKYEKNKYEVASTDSSEDEETCDDQVDESLENEILSDRLIDVGKLDDEETLTLFQYIAGKYITVKYFPPNVYTSRISFPDDLVHRTDDVISFRSYEKNPKHFVAKFAKKYTNADQTAIGYLPWKMFISDIIVVDKEPLYIYKYAAKVEEVIKIVEDICSYDGYEARNARFLTHFPPK